MVITATEFQSFPLIVGVLAHEYGHAMRLPELYDVTGAPPADQGAGIGLWGVMGRGPVGWRRDKIGERHFGSGPTAMSAWSRIRVGWITPETVSADTLGVQIHDVNSEDGKVFKIPVPNSDKEYFLVENRQNTYSETKNTTMVGSYYDDYAPASGLAIWHVDDTVGFSNTANTTIDDEDPGSMTAANANEFHKRVDLECADGLFSDQGYPGNRPDAVDGGDNLDYFSFDSAYVKNGNLGDLTDVWNGLADTRLRADTLFTHYTNPSTAGYNDNDQQNVFTGIALRDIRSSSPGVMQMDIYLQYWAGPITSNTTWSGRITVGGDVTIESGVTLTVKRGTEVRFLANTDDTGGGKDQTRSELIVKGKLDADAGDITFRSSDDPGTNADWYGIRIVSGGTAELSGATIQNGVHCVQKEGGTVTGLSDANTRLHNCGATIVEAQYAYRASQTTPLFDAAASGTPDNWSSSELTWTDAAPRVWKISRTRPHGETWSEWGNLEKFSERPAAPPVFYYLHSASAPGIPDNKISDQPPSGWLSSEPEATATQGVWRTERTRPAGETHYRFSTPIQIQTEYAYRLHTSGTTAPSFTVSASDVPTGWSSSRQPPTSAYAPYEWQISRTRPTGGSWSDWGSATVVSTYTEYQYAYKRNNSGTTAPAFSSTASGVPYGWSSSRQPPTSSNRYEWRISRTRPTGGTWSSWSGATVVSTYTERQYAYRVGNSGSTAPSFSASSSGIPSGWSSSRRTPGPSVPYEWRITRTRPTIRGIWVVGPWTDSENRPAVKPTWAGRTLHTRRVR